MIHNYVIYEIFIRKMPIKYNISVYYIHNFKFQHILFIYKQENYIIIVLYLQVYPYQI